MRGISSSIAAISRDRFSPQCKAGVRQGGAFVGVFPMSGINPAYLMKPGEGRDLFEGWTLLYYTENERTEILAEKPRS